ncbi:hypothetical protein B0H16DRAFT_1023383 [Mycena metata]|uniref:Uncharacterized protein n=1 Tax=Mycena metata TaxID=1033252 RepID=A0AAD7IHB0_9AGAR|nr:hypothetical protein B0H16DRAFT_1023383 [Mycena metata]
MTKTFHRRASPWVDSNHRLPAVQSPTEWRKLAMREFFSSCRRGRTHFAHRPSKPALLESTNISRAHFASSVRFYSTQNLHYSRRDDFSASAPTKRRKKKCAHEIADAFPTFNTVLCFPAAESLRDDIRMIPSFRLKLMPLKLFADVRSPAPPHVTAPSTLTEILTRAATMHHFITGPCKSFSGGFRHRHRQIPMTTTIPR